MPPLPHIHLSPLREALKQSARQGVPAENVTNALHEAFSVAMDLEPGRQYPAAWLMFRLGLTHEGEITATANGEELLADLAAVVEHLTEQARLQRSQLSPEWKTLDGLASEWNVSRKTIDRYRKRGLLAWRVRDEAGKPVLMVQPEHAARFAARHVTAIARASGFERIDAATQARMLRRAALYRARFGCTLNQVAERLAERYGRSREAVRALIKRGSDTDGSDPAPARARFTEPQALSERDGLVCFRAVQRGIDPALLARRFRKPMGSIRRAIGLAQLAQVRAHATGLLLLDDETLSDGQISAALASPPAQTGLQVRGVTDLAEFLSDAGGTFSVLAIEESTRMAAYRATRVRAARLLRGINHNFPATTELDEIVTLLRWASRLKCWLMRSQFRLSVQTLEASFATPLSGLRSSESLAVCREMILLLSDLVDQQARSEPRGRLAAPVGLAMNRLAGKWLKERLQTLPGKAAVRATSRPSGTLPDWTQHVHVWQRDIEGPEWLRRVVPRLTSDSRQLLTLRYGWDEQGTPPRTLESCMSTLGWSRIRAVRQERKAMHEALTLIRTSGGQA